LLLEFLEAFIHPRRLSKEDRAYEQENRDRGSEEGDDFEDHCPLSVLLCLGNPIVQTSLAQ
jgi:hypothetical protein